MKDTSALKTAKLKTAVNSHSAENEAVFIGQVVANQVVEAEDANFKDGVISTQAEVRDRQNAHKLYTTIRPYRANIKTFLER